MGGLAWKAYQSYQESRAGSQEAYPTRAETHAPGQSHLAAAPTPAVAEETWQMLPQSSFDIDASSAEGSRGLLLVRAMIAAAMSDGHLDGSERSRIMAKIDELGLDAEERALVCGELLQPKTADAIAAAVGDQATGIEVYAASLLAIDESRHQGRLYLDELARRLNLPPLLIEALGTRVETEREAIAKPATN